jgi:hypothetical protein
MFWLYGNVFRGLDRHAAGGIPAREPLKESA